MKKKVVPVSFKGLVNYTFKEQERLKNRDFIVNTILHKVNQEIIIHFNETKTQKAVCGKIENFDLLFLFHRLTAFLGSLVCYLIQFFLKKVKSSVCKK